MIRDTVSDASLPALVVPGTVLAGKFQIVRKLGRGGMGVVVEAHHMELDERVALKFLQQKATNETVQLQRFYREARAAAKLKSEHATRVLDVGKLDSGEPYMVMEHLEGIDLSKYLKTKGKLPITDAVDYILQACDAVAEAHAIGIIHRDLKPANLFLADQPDGTRIVKVLDFGIAKQDDDESSGLTDTALVFGSMVYMSPEQTKSTRDVDHRTDVYALGVTLYELIAGRPPFYARLVPEIMMQKAQGKSTPLRELVPHAPPELAKVLEKAFDREAERRYSSIALLSKALEPFGSEASKHLLARINRINENTTRTLSRAKILPELKQFAREIEAELPPDDPVAANDAEPGARNLDWSDEWSDEWSMKDRNAPWLKQGSDLPLPKLSGPSGVSIIPRLNQGDSGPPTSSTLASASPVLPAILAPKLPPKPPPPPPPLPLPRITALADDDEAEEALRPLTAQQEMPAQERSEPPPPKPRSTNPPQLTGAADRPQDSVPPLGREPIPPAKGEPLDGVDSKQRKRRQLAMGGLLAVLLLAGAGVGLFLLDQGGPAGTPGALNDSGTGNAPQGIGATTTAATVAAAAPPLPTVARTANPIATATDTAAPPDTGAPAQAAAPDASTLRHLCAPGTKASTECSNGLSAWCDKDEKRIACCDVGFVATGSNEACGCPEGGPLMIKAIAAGCKLPPDSKPITPATIQETMQAKYPELFACYKSAPPDPRRPSVRTVMGLELTPDGRVYAARIDSSSMPNAEAEACLLGIASGLTFPPPPATGLRFIHPLIIPLNK
jgi:serine/threonine-protein kinase